MCASALVQVRTGLAIKAEDDCRKEHRTHATGPSCGQVCVESRLQQAEDPFYRRAYSATFEARVSMIAIFWSSSCGSPCRSVK